MEDWDVVLQQYHRATRQILDECLVDMPTTRIDPNDNQQLIAICIFATILQIASECMDLLEKSSSVTSVAGMLRSIAESYADLCALILDDNYTLCMTATFFHERKRLARNMTASTGNPYHADFAKQMDPAKDLAEMTKRLAEMKALGIKPLSPKGRFVAAGLLEIYESLYWNLSLEAHNSISSVHERHLGEKDGCIEIVIFKENRPNQIAMYYDALVSMLTDCAVRLHRFLGSSRLPHYDKRAGDLANLKARFFPTV